MRPAEQRVLRNVPIPYAALLALATLLYVPGCGGGSGEGAVAALAVTPNTLPESLETTLLLTGATPEPGAMLVVDGTQSFPCRPGRDGALVCTVPAFALSGGAHTVAMSNNPLALAGIQVQPQPLLSGARIDVDDRGRLELSGQGFVPPVDVTSLGEDDAPLGPPSRATVVDDRTLLCPPPLVPGVGRQATARVQIRNGDGQAAREPLRIVLSREFRSLDGSGNNRENEEWGRAGTPLARRLPADYADGVSALGGVDRPNARAVSNAVCRAGGNRPNARGASDMFWQWGQFLDHDIDLTPAADPSEIADIVVPTGDEDFDPTASGAVVLPFDRSAYDPASLPRQQLNVITAFLDASNVYGSDETRARVLRTLDGTGRLRTSSGALLPFNDAGLPNAGGTSAALFLAGDERANEQVGLTAMHTLFVREHNRRADELRREHPTLEGEDVYLEARRHVAALMQVITYEEFLPLLLGPDALGRYRGYEPATDPRIANSFSTAAYRFGHSMLSGTLLRLDEEGAASVHGHLALRDAFFNPTRLIDEGGIEPVLRGLAAQHAQELDAELVDDVRSFLFGPPGAGGLDLAALNIQRGRDHGLPSYNDARARAGLSRHASFDDVSQDPVVRQRLASVYASVHDVDLWVGALCEDAGRDAMVGPLLATLLTDQFRRLRDGDRFWYERILTGRALDALRRTRLSDVIRRNTSIGRELAQDVFRAGAAVR